MSKNTQLFPKGLFLTFVVIILGINMYYFIQEDKKILFYIILFTIFGLLSSFAIHIFSLSSFGSGRLHVSLGMTIGYIFLMTFVSSELLNDKKIIACFLKGILIFYLLTNIVNFYILTYDHQVANKIDKQQVINISNYIEEYEKKSGIEVKFITMKYFPNTQSGHYKNRNSINSFALYSECSYDGIINFYTKRNLQEIYLTQEINEKYIREADGKKKCICIEDILVCPIYNF